MHHPLIPQEKKWRSYERDCVVRGGENDKAYRRWRPRKKAKVRRANRQRLERATRQLCAENAVGVNDALQASGVDLRAVALKAPPKKWGVTPLGQHVKWLLARRVAKQHLDVWQRWPAIKEWLAAAASPRQIPLEPPNFTPIKP